MAQPNAIDLLNSTFMGVQGLLQANLAALDRINHQLGTLGGRLAAIDERTLEIMNSIDDLNDEVAKLSQTATDTAARVVQQQAASAAAAAALQTIIDDLNAHQAAPDLSSQIAGLEAINTALGQIASAPAPTP